MRWCRVKHPRLRPHSPRARLQSWDKLLLRLALALHCSPTTLELLPVGRLKAMATELGKKE